MHHVPVDEVTRQVDVEKVRSAWTDLQISRYYGSLTTLVLFQVEALINDNTIFLVGSACNFPDGAIDGESNVAGARCGS